MKIQVTRHASGDYRHVSVIDGGRCPEQLMNEIDTMVKEIANMSGELHNIELELGIKLLIMDDPTRSQEKGVIIIKQIQALQQKLEKSKKELKTMTVRLDRIFPQVTLTQQTEPDIERSEVV